MKAKHLVRVCLSTLLLLLSVGCALALSWPVALEGSATVRNVVYESFMSES